jgi:hypothetical protein
MCPSLRHTVFLVLACLLTGILLIAAPSASAQAGFTTIADPAQPTNPSGAATGGCLNGPGGVNCNNYAAKENVYISGGPIANTFGAGCFYFSVLVPGFQNGGFIDGANGNLSDTTPSNDSKSNPSEQGAGGGDTAASRIFSVDGAGNVTYPATDPACTTSPAFHATGIQPKTGRLVIQMIPFNDTTNMGGVYIAAVCVVGATDPSQCKFDAFRIKQNNTCTQSCGGNSTLTVCKFWDQNLDHTWNNDEPFIGFWPITATNVDGNGGQATQSTDNTVVGGLPGPNFGCAIFQITVPQGQASVDVTLTEGSAPADPSSQSCNLGAQTCQVTPTASWTQSAPADFSTTPPTVLTSETITVPANSDVTADQNFGNFFGQDLTVAKTATPSFTRTYAWTIAKSLVSPTGNPVEESGSSVTITYSVTASETGFTDSNWQVNGSITVTNPNGFDVTGVNVSDAVDDGGTCKVTDVNGGLNETVPANGSIAVPYSCTYSSQPTYNVTATNTATATWDKTKFGTPDASATGQKTFVFSTPTAAVNKTVTVTDTFNGGAPTTLGTLTATDSMPFTTHTYTVTQNVKITGGKCATFTNTATVTGDNFSTTTPPVTVTICNEQTGALTMGFWQNKNGQGIITGGASTLGVCNSGSWLRQFNPFSDLSSTASCSGVASYVLNVIKNAVCTSTTKTCNSMLKAQMLATALDVYFSDTGLGGNKIGAPGPIGAVAIDLTHVCNMIDGSGGSATCSGTFSNVASLFGVAKCATVMAMLLYQNTSDPLPDGGAVWYGQVKANQVGAKNAFDAVNNQVAAICP